MNNSHLKLLCAAAVAALAWSGAAQAQIAGQSSDGTKVNVGASTVLGGPHVPGRPGIGVPNTGLTTRVDFQGLQASVGTDVNGVSTVSAVTGTITDHSQFGRFDFAKVGTANLYFGEWTQTGSATAGDHTVYYVGDDGGTTTRPSPGTATYSVKGISDYANRGLLTGTFTANFIGGSSGTLTGSLASSAGHTVNIGTAVISGINFSGSSASVTPVGGSAITGGAVSGRFFGAGATALAGITTFAGNRQYDTAFGGTKN